MGFYQYIYYSTYTLSFLDTTGQSFLEGTSVRNFLVAFDSKRTVADLFSDRKGGSLESRSHFRPDRNGCLEKTASNTKSMTLFANTPPPPTSPWPFFQNWV